MDLYSNNDLLNYDVITPTVLTALLKRLSLPQTSLWSF